MKIIDLHCDTLLKLFGNKKYSLFENDGHIDLKRLSEGGVTAQCFAIFLPQSNDITDTSRLNFKLLKKQYKLFAKQLRLYSGLISPAVNREEIIKNQKDNKISAILTVENGDFIGNDLNRINVIKSMGVKIMSLTWNFENSLGFASANKSAALYPLKSIGRQAVEMLNRLDIIIDVSHLNIGGFWDVVNLSENPFIASHSCCDAILRHPRNLSDEQLKAIGNSGGVVGINFYADFIRNDKKATSISDIIAQAKHIKNISGIDAVCFGSDFDGMDCLMQWNDCSGYPIIVNELSKHFSDYEIEKICYKNAMRILS